MQHFFYIDQGCRTPKKQNSNSTFMVVILFSSTGHGPVRKLQLSLAAVQRCTTTLFFIAPSFS